MSKSNKIAHVYASSLLDVTDDEKKRQQAEKDLDSLHALMAENIDLQKALEAPLFTATEKRRLVDDLSSKLKLNSTSMHFLQLLADKGRLNLFTAILQEYKKLCAEARGEIHVELVTAVAATEKQKSGLKKAVLDGKKGEVEFIEKVDPSLIGGMILKIGSKQIDLSVRNRINNLERALKGA